MILRFMTRVSDVPSRSAAEKDALITTLLARVEALVSRVTALESEVVELRAENAGLRAKLRLPPKTPSNSSTPPSQGHKANGDGANGDGANGDGKAKPKGEVHAGVHRPLHSNPTRRREMLAERCGHCHADAVIGVFQEAVH